MKFNFLFLLLGVINIALAQSVHSDSVQQFRLQGVIVGMDSGYLRLKYTGADGIYHHDTIAVKNEHFYTTGNIDEPTFLFVEGDIKSRSVDDPNHCEIFLEPGNMQVRLVVNNFKKVHVIGSKTQSEYDFLNIEHGKIENPYLGLYKSFEKMKDTLQIDTGNMTLIKRYDLLRRQVRDVRMKVNKVDLHYASSHPASYLSPYLLFYLFDYFPLDTIKAISRRFDGQVSRGHWGKLVLDKIAGIERRKIGSVAGDFIAKDMKGDTVKLSNFKGKNYILLDFWATWCIPCRKNMSHLIDIYKKYNANGLQIIGIANDDERQEYWKKAIINDGTEIWPQILQSANTKNDIGKKFGVTPIPAKILINKDGIVIFSNEGDDDKGLDVKLAEIFGHQ
jgi:peroxiredoxin